MREPPFFRELQLNNLGDYNVVPRDFRALPIPAMSVAFDDGEPILVGSNDPNNEFEAVETQMVSPDLVTPHLQQWSVKTTASSIGRRPPPSALTMIQVNA